MRAWLGRLRQGFQHEGLVLPITFGSPPSRSQVGRRCAAGEAGGEDSRFVAARFSSNDRRSNSMSARR